MSGVGEGQGTERRIEDAVDHGYKAAGGKVAQQRAVDTLQNFARTQDVLRNGAKYTAGSRHQQRRGHPFSGNIGEYKSPFAIGKLDVVVPITAYSPRGKRRTGYKEVWQQQGSFRQKLLLNQSRLVGLFDVSLIQLAFTLKQARVLDRDGDVLGECMQQLQLPTRKSIQFGMGCVEYPDHPIPNLERNGHGRHGGFFAGEIVRIEAHIG